MTTKERIIEASINLFNQHGYANVTIEMIGKAAGGLSKGNVAYHYKNRGIILHQIHKQMESEMESVIKPAGLPGLDQFLRIQHHFFRFQEKYRFFFLDLVEITRKHPEIAKRHEKVTRKRMEEGRALMNYFIGSGWIKPEVVKGTYDKLIHTMWLINTFWLSQNRIFQSNLIQLDKNNAIEMIWQLFKPYLTEEGSNLYQDI